MSKITLPGTDFLVGDPDIVPLSADDLPSREEVADAASGLILSASGWRKVFAADGDEESDDGKISGADAVLAGAAAIAFAGFLGSRGPSASPAVLVGIDSRPTGPAIADAMIRVFLGLGISPRYLFIVAAPELMAFARARAEPEPSRGQSAREERGRRTRLGAAEAATEGPAEGFCYVSASHNPRGHNGLKFGLRDGGVLGAGDSASLIAAFKSLLARDGMAAGGLAARVLALMEEAEPGEVARVFSGCPGWKRRAVSAYTLFAREVISGTDSLGEQERLFDEMAAAAERKPVGVVAELNGSARCLSIDRDFLAGIGVRTRAVNDRPREFAHRIVPEGESLDVARRELEAAAVADPAFVAGYVPDCDGDRGNLVVLHGNRVGARPVEAQEVFALCCVAELSQLVRDGRLGYDDAGNATQKVAVVVNDATSMRINAIARAFDVDVYRAETGEANVVGLASALRGKGYIVRILGEGSNGGNITYPSAVRDPLATLGALLKLLLLRGGSLGGIAGAGREGLFEIWLRRSSALGSRAASRYDPDFGIDEILASLPAFATTSVFEDRAALRVRSADQAALKARYASIFAREWEGRRKELAERFGIVSWEAFATKGQEEIRVGSDFAASGRGGLRIAFADESGAPRAFVWMRGSGTEPVFRVLADVEAGLAEDEEYFLGWHTSMVRQADV